jgi:hypothetical protein
LALIRSACLRADGGFSAALFLPVFAGLRLDATFGLILFAGFRLSLPWPPLQCWFNRPVLNNALNN